MEKEKLGLSAIVKSIGCGRPVGRNKTRSGRTKNSNFSRVHGDHVWMTSQQVKEIGLLRGMGTLLA